jgi:manganese/zinc/iron transport system permease protein
MGLATRMQTGTAAGLSSFIYGKTASMLFLDAVLIGTAALLCALFCLLLFKEFTLVCFDADYATTQGWPTGRLDFMMMTLVVVVTVIGLQAVGLILVVALLIIPPSAARFWTYRLGRMMWLAGLFGALSGLLGSTLSALMANLPAGAVIVLTAAAIFTFSLFFGSARGLLRTMLERLRLQRKIFRENLLRELYEWQEANRGLPAGGAAAGPTIPEILASRSWPPALLKRQLRTLRAQKLIGTTAAGDPIVLTAAGMTAARGVVRKHRLWETYLITHADIAPGQVDWGADRIEHVLDEELIAKLERLLPDAGEKELLQSPHELTPTGGGS